MRETCETEEQHDDDYFIDDFGDDSLDELDSDDDYDIEEHMELSDQSDDEMDEWCV